MPPGEPSTDAQAIDNAPTASAGASGSAAPPRGRPRSPTVDLPTKRRRKHGRSRKPRRDNRKSRFDADYTADDERNNPHFEAYYRAQAIVPEHEYDALFATLAIPLPTSFRIAASGKERERIQMRLRGEMTDLFTSVEDTGKEEEKEAIKPPRPLPWYPEELAWTVSAPRQMLRRNNVLSSFHKFLVEMNDIGAINRQEAVSMIPPLMLDVQPGHCVIDLCAAPGSKTAQILETASAPGSKSDVPALKRNGLVIANDADIRRCWMLSHQLKRFASQDLVVTHHDAQFFPKILMFDRVLCDVPCTGDGTLRKAPDIWRRWTPDMGIGIHRLQRQILERGLDILKPGGRLVYSTCSMNPLENEAVVAHALRKYGDDIELLNVSDMLPGLIRRPGLTTWKVKDNSSNVKTTSDDDVKNSGAACASEQGQEADAVAGENGDESGAVGGDGRGSGSKGWFVSFDKVPLRRRKKIVHSLFPPSEDEVKSGKFPLERCMRLVPHDQDTGAFFVSVFVKKAEARVHRRLQRIQEEMQNEAQRSDGNRTSNGAAQVEGANGGADGLVQHGASAQFDGAKIAVGKTGGPATEDGRTDFEKADMGTGEESEAGEGAADGPERAGTAAGGPEGELGGAGSNGQGGKDEGRNKGRGGSRLITDDPLVGVGELNGEMLGNICSFFGVGETVGSDVLMTRGSDAGTFKRVVAVSPRVRNVLRYSIGSRADGQAKQVLRVVNAGVRVLERTDRRDTTCPFRLIAEGLELLREVMTKRVVRTSCVEFVEELVGETAVKLEGISEAGVRAELEGLSSGSCVVELVREADAGRLGGAAERVVCWKGRSNVAAVMPREHRAGVAGRLRGGQSAGSGGGLTHADEGL